MPICRILMVWHPVYSESNRRGRGNADREIYPSEWISKQWPMHLKSDFYHPLPERNHAQLERTEMM